MDADHKMAEAAKDMYIYVCVVGMGLPSGISGCGCQHCMLLATVSVRCNSVMVEDLSWAVWSMFLCCFADEGLHNANVPTFTPPEIPKRVKLRGSCVID